MKFYMFCVSARNKKNFTNTLIPPSTYTTKKLVNKGKKKYIMISKCFQGDEYLCLYSDLSYRHVYLIYALIFHKTIRSPRLHLHDCIFLNLHHQLNNSCLEGMLRFAELFEFDTILRRTPRACLLPFSKRL